MFLQPLDGTTNFCKNDDWRRREDDVGDFCANTHGDPARANWEGLRDFGWLKCLDPVPGSPLTLSPAFNPNLASIRIHGQQYGTFPWKLNKMLHRAGVKGRGLSSVLQMLWLWLEFDRSFSSTRVATQLELNYPLLRRHRRRKGHCSFAMAAMLLSWRPISSRTVASWLRLPCGKCWASQRSRITPVGLVLVAK